ncbi:hypothetical protein EDC04DRAFT_576541 [Pisolithus marmoratus]|nr:hypothetical protein EDC04DRAFT_576541 [Pisolithus marmoratus]
MHPLDWYSALERLLEWIGTREGHIKRRMWACHFRFLARRDNFVEKFPITLLFDIEFRSSCVSNPNFLSRKRFLQHRICHLQSAAAYDSSPDKVSFHTHNAFLLIIVNLTGKVLTNPSVTTDVPPPSVSSVPSHKFSACTEEITQKGQQTFSKSRDRHVTTLVSSNNSGKVVGVQYSNCDHWLLCTIALAPKRLLMPSLVVRYRQYTYTMNLYTLD